MIEQKFKELAANKNNALWEKLIERTNDLYSRHDEIRTPFSRDYTRVLHSTAYRRLKHKTQVFFNIENDHICTRMEHVNHVESVSSTIARALGLNEELTKAISIAHDLGHAPFGHRGESVIKGLTKKYLKKDFWHEQNGLRFVDKIELLEDNYNKRQNLNLTYAVRDGIISHCGEVDDNGISPRDISISVDDLNVPGEYQAVTWEGCVVKMADKIAYVGRDIEDAIRLGFLDTSNINELVMMARENDTRAMNTTVIIHNMIIDICKNSSPDSGICLSKKYYEQLKTIKEFNYNHIYNHKRLEPFKHYACVVIKEIFNMLLSYYDGKHTLNNLERDKQFYPILIGNFSEWLACFCNNSIISDQNLVKISLNCKNQKIYEELQTEELYIQAIIDYISGMTDRFAISTYNELLAY